MTDSLPDRIERAEGPCRELDAEIAAAVGVKHGPDSGWCNNHNGDYWTVDESAPAYTASLDAATTLVPEGCGWFAAWGQTSPSEPMGGAIITAHAKFAGYDVANDPIAEAEAATPALALCAAALRAHAGEGQ